METREEKAVLRVLEAQGRNHSLSRALSPLQGRMGKGIWGQR